MDEQAYNEAVERLKKVNAVIAGLDEAIRATAFGILRPYVEPASRRAGREDDDHDDGGGDGGGGGGDDREPEEELEAFFDEHQSDKDADNAHAAAAFWYSRYGKEPFTQTDIRDIADNADINVPDRFDAVVIAKRDGKSLYRRVAKGQYRPTPHGERFLKETYGVTKGRKKPPAADAA